MDRYLQEEFKQSMKIRLNFNNMMEKFVGEQGLSEADLEKLDGKIGAMEKAMVEKRKNGGMDWRDLPYNQDEVVEDIIAYAQSVHQNRPCMDVIYYLCTVCIKLKHIP